ncbi:MAG: hypothetical protein WBA17_10940 [Saprospiraceae bacterium]
MQEKNRDRLREALQNLPAHDPPKNTWDNLVARLNTPVSLADRMPAYAPPPGVWNGLNEGLDRQKRSRVVHLRRRRVLGTAAAAALLLTAATALWQLNQGPSVSYAFATEQISHLEVADDWEADEDRFDGLMVKLADHNEPTHNELLLELEEMDDARNQIMSMLNSYGNDANLLNKLADVERTRSELYRRAIALVY